METLVTAAGPGNADWCVSVHTSTDPLRGEVEAFIGRIYTRAHGALIRRHFPTLVCVRDGQFRIASAAGFRAAAAEPLFLEQYLDEPIEAAVSAALGHAIPRREIGEIGSLVSESMFATSRLFLELSQQLQAAGCKTVAATLTRGLRWRLARSGVRFTILAEARPERLGDASDDWGRYFDHSPEVVAGEIGWDSLLRPVQ